MARNTDAVKKRRSGKMGQFLREVGLELKKVHWPTRKQLLVYTGVVLASLAVMAVIIGAFDFVLSQAMDWVIKQ